MYDTICKIKGPLLYMYCLRFEIILNSYLLRQKCRQCDRTLLRGGLRLPSNSTLNMIRRQHLYAMKHKGSFYRCFKFQSRERDINQLSVIFDSPSNIEKFSKILVFSAPYKELWPLFSQNNINILINFLLKSSRANIILILVHFCQASLSQ